MKIRQGFVSNSSSSSFILGIAKILSITSGDFNLYQTHLYLEKLEILQS